VYVLRRLLCITIVVMEYCIIAYPEGMSIFYYWKYNLVDMVDAGNFIMIIHWYYLLFGISTKILGIFANLLNRLLEIIFWSEISWQGISTCQWRIVCSHELVISRPFGVSFKSEPVNGYCSINIKLRAVKYWLNEGKMVTLYGHVHAFVWPHLITILNIELCLGSRNMDVQPYTISDR
jgi:hypothetical protein